MTSLMVMKRLPSPSCVLMAMRAWLPSCSARRTSAASNAAVLAPGPRSPPIDRHPLQVARPDVDRLRPDESVVLELFDHVSRPACGASHSEHRREESRWDAGRMEDERGVQLDVGVEIASRLQ